jgi:phospholipid transport system substrate-binding protein
MSTAICTLRLAGLKWPTRFRAAGLWGLVLSVLCAAWLTAQPASAADPAVKFMVQVGRDLMAAARTRSPTDIADVIQRYGDVSYIGLYSLGSYRSQLSSQDKTVYYGGMVRWISRYAATEAPNYPIAKIEWADDSSRGSNGIMVDSTVTLEDGSVYEVRWLLTRNGDTFKVRDAMVVGFWMTPFLKQLFEDYIAQNNGNPRALIMALNR